MVPPFTQTADQLCGRFFYGETEKDDYGCPSKQLGCLKVQLGIVKLFSDGVGSNRKNFSGNTCLPGHADGGFAGGQKIGKDRGNVKIP
jgi:hypothetical protein